MVCWVFVFMSFLCFLGGVLVVCSWCSGGVFYFIFLFLILLFVGSGWLFCVVLL